MPAENNNLNNAQFRGISHAGINGLSVNKPALTGTAADVALLLTGEGNPRDASRLPTMARLECIVAGSNAGTWDGQLSGCWLRKDSRNAQQRLGSPGSLGGKDFQTFAVQASGGRIAYDLARLALKHAKNIAERVVEIADNAWNLPTAANGDTVAASVLQTIAPHCETPEFSTVNVANYPATLTDFVNNIVGLLPATIAGPLGGAVGGLTANPNANRVYDELKAEYSASHHGRRDAFWAASSILTRARQLIYIEGSYFGRTDYASPATNGDLIQVIKNQLTAKPNLKLMIALSKDLIYGHGYDTFKAREIAKRKEVIDDLKSHAAGRVVAFHPIGFPGRPLQLMTNALIVDDMWALVGSSSFRRRGFTFDGAADLVFFDKNISDGVSTRIRDLRKSLMAIHLNINAQTTPTAFPNPNAVRIHDMQQAFSTVKDMLDRGGAGIIEDIWDGNVSGTTAIDPAAYPADDIADPEGRDFNVISATLFALINAAGTAAP